jgi:hypothetical protein
MEVAGDVSVTILSQNWWGIFGDQGPAHCSSSTHPCLSREYNHGTDIGRVYRTSFATWEMQENLAWEGLCMILRFFLLEARFAPSNGQAVRYPYCLPIPLMRARLLNSPRAFISRPVAVT